VPESLEDFFQLVDLIEDWPGQLLVSATQKREHEGAGKTVAFEQPTTVRIGAPRHNLASSTTKG